MVELKLSERQGVEIDYCPQCRGVWLDRGELDKILERTQAPTEFRSREEDERVFTRERYRERERDRDHDRDDEAHYARRGHRRKSFLEELFDFD
jgi:Zn-finger nucleic acid-binding protein